MASAQIYNGTLPRYGFGSCDCPLPAWNENHLINFCTSFLPFYPPFQAPLPQVFSCPKTDGPLLGSVFLRDGSFAHSYFRASGFSESLADFVAKILLLVLLEKVPR